MVHEFVNGWCKVCGETLDHLADNKLRDRALIGPKLPIDEMQGTLQLTMTVIDF